MIFVFLSFKNGQNFFDNQFLDLTIERYQYIFTCIICPIYMYNASSRLKKLNSLLRLRKRRSDRSIQSFMYLFAITSQARAIYDVILGHHFLTATLFQTRSHNCKFFLMFCLQNLKKSGNRVCQNDAVIFVCLY